MDRDLVPAIGRAVRIGAFIAIPGGPLNDRFRNKANNGGLGVAYTF